MERRSVRGFNPDKERTSSKLLRTAEKELVRRDLKVFVRGVLACFGVHSCIFLCGNQNAGEQEQDHEREREKTAEWRRLRQIIIRSNNGGVISRSVDRESGTSVPKWLVEVADLQRWDI